MSCVGNTGSELLVPLNDALQGVKACRGILLAAHAEAPLRHVERDAINRALGIEGVPWGPRAQGTRCCWGEAAPAIAADYPRGIPDMMTAFVSLDGEASRVLRWISPKENVSTMDEPCSATMHKWYAREYDARAVVAEMRVKCVVLF